MNASAVAIAASTPGVAEHIDHLAELVLAAGGSVHPRARFVEQDGELSVHLDGDPADLPLLVVPESLLVPVDGIDWDPDPDRIAVRSGDAGLSEVQRSALEAMLGLYEVTGKPVWAQRSLPGCSLPQDPVALAAVTEVQPGFGSRGSSVAEVFIDSRVFHHQLGADGGSQRVLMPLVDLVDHHRSGAPLRVVDGAMTIGVVRAAAGTACWVTYGPRRSPLSMALHFGFVDASAVHAPSVGFTVDAADSPLGVAIAVEGRRLRPRSGFDPPHIDLDAEGIRLSHLTFDVEHPGRLPAIVALGLAGVGRRSGLAVPEPDAAARWLLDEAARRNAAALDGIVAALDAPRGSDDPLEGSAPPRSWAVVSEAARVQRSLITAAVSTDS